MPQDILVRCLRGVPQVRNDNLIVTSETYDDAGVYRLSDDTALVQTVDVFTPVVDDPYWFGAIVAANALSDVYAMGGKPITVLCVLGFPGQLDPSIMTEILKGSAEVVRDSGAVIAGGHTLIDAELKFGLAVTGLVHPDRVVRNSTAKVGDNLVLTKPLGTGLLTTGLKRGIVKDEGLSEQVTKMMAALNRGAGEAMMAVGVSAATDITGYGLLGHSKEMAEGSGVTLRFCWSAIPTLPDDVETLAESCMSGGTSNNRRHVMPDVTFHPDVSHARQVVLFDAQTSGGLLISVPADRTDALLAELQARGVSTRAVVGEVVERRETPLEVVP
jgi:selenide, water dikinase